MKNSKKGITLVELVICCAIIVMLGGACTAVLASGSNVFNTSTKTASAQLDSDVLQTFMINLIPSTKNFTNEKSLAEAKNLTQGNAFYFDDDNDGLFTVRVNGNSTAIQSVSELQYSIIRAGDPNSETARAQFIYTATLKNGSTLNGGFVLSNMKYVESSMSVFTDVLASEHPFCFNLDS